MAQQPAPSAAAAVNPDPHAELRKTWQPGQRWQARSFRNGQWGPWTDAVASEPFWFPHQDYRRHPDDLAPKPSPTPKADSSQDEPLQAFDSPRAKALMRAWEEGWAACRDAEYVGEEAQNDAFNSSHTLTLCIAEDQQLPAPQADSQPAPQGETNAQLDTDSNPPTPGQQRDVAGPVALGQPVGNGSDQAAGHTGAQGDKLLTVAERNIRSFLRSAVFKSESDREAALNCVDVLWEAARAPADSVTAPAAGAVAGPERIALANRIKKCAEHWAYMERIDHGDQAKFEQGRHAEMVDLLAAAPTPPTQAADSVLEDAARLEQIAEAIRDYHHALDMRKHGGLAESAAFSSICNTMGMHWNRGEEAARRAARKQGANHDNA